MEKIKVQENNLYPPLENLIGLQRMYYEKSLACFDPSKKQQNVPSPFAKPMTSIKSELWDPNETKTRINSLSSTPEVSSNLKKASFQLEDSNQFKETITPKNNGQTDSSLVHSFDSSEKILKKVQAKYAFVKDPENTDELSIHKGDLLDVLDIVQGGWLYGRNSKGDCGLFPENYVEDYLCTNEDSKISIGSSNNVSKSFVSPPSYLDSLPKQDITENVSSSCGNCSCKEFSPNVFKRGQCNNCFHIH